MMFDPTTEDADLLFEQAEAEREADHVQTAAVLYAQASEAYLLCGNTAMAAVSLRWRGAQLFNAGDPGAAAQAYAEAADLALRADDMRLRLACMWGQADVAASMREWQLVEELCDEAIPLMREYEYVDYLPDMLLLQARCLYWTDREEEALNSAVEATAAHRGFGVIHGQLRSDDFALTVLLFLRRHEEALQIARRNLEIAKSSSDEASQAFHRVRLGEALLAADKPKDAAVEFERARVAYREAGWAPQAGVAGMWLGRAETRLGRADRAVDALRTAVAVLDAAGPRWSPDRDAARHRLADVLYGRGDCAESAAADALLLAEYADGDRPLDRYGANAVQRHTAAQVHLERPQEALRLLTALDDCGALADIGEPAAGFVARASVAWATWHGGDRAKAHAAAVALLEECAADPGSLAEAWVLDILGTTAEPDDPIGVARLARAQAIYWQWDEFERLGEVAELLLERTAPA